MHRFQMRLRRNKKLVTKFFSSFTAGSKFSSVTRVIGVIEPFGLRRYASFSDALSMRWRNKQLVTIIRVIGAIEVCFLPLNFHRRQC